MLKIEQCKTKNIFAFGVGDLLSLSDVSAYYMVYAPLSDCATIVDSEEWQRIKSHIDSQSNVADEVVEALLDDEERSLEESVVKDFDDFQNLTILPNNKCNFNCSFCYSAGSREGEVLRFDTIKIAIDRFIREDSADKLTLSIMGGGEPLLSWEVVEQSILYAEQRASDFGKHLSSSVTTNGSLLNDHIIEFIRDHKIITIVSFEVLEQIQNLQRGHYDIVKQKVERMFELGATPQFNTVITPANVELMEEIVNQATTEYPQLKYLCMDPVIDVTLYPTIESLREYHDKYITNFFKARELGLKHNVKVDSTANISMDCTISRYCAGEFAVTNKGFITICPCVSSEKEQFFDSYIYGSVSVSDGVRIDDVKLKKLLNTNLYSDRKCDRCPVKYNCAGGCMHKNNTLNTEYRAECCRFMREFARMFLFAKLDNNCFEESGTRLKELV